MSCDVDSERVAFEECEASCLGQQALYETWEDARKQSAFEDHRRCLMDATCDDIADGVCYDPEVFVFVPR